MHPSQNPRRNSAAIDRQWAIAAESLYLANLLIAPGLAFVALLWLHRHTRTLAMPLACQHLRQTLIASLWAGALLAGLSTGILLIGGLASMWSWVALILYFTTIHATLVLLGMFGLARAMNGQPFRFPLIGPREVA